MFSNEYIPEQYTFEEYCELHNLDQEKILEHLKRSFVQGMRRPGTGERTSMEYLFFEEDFNPDGWLRKE